MQVCEWGAQLYIMDNYIAKWKQDNTYKIYTYLNGDEIRVYDFYIIRKNEVYGSYAEARGIKDMQLIDGSENSTIDDLTQWTVEADKVLTF